MYHLNSDEYYENKIHDLEEALSKCSMENGRLIIKLKGFEEVIRRKDRSLFIQDEELEKARESLNISLKELDTVRKEKIIVEMKVIGLEDEITKSNLIKDGDYEDDSD